MNWPALLARLASLVKGLPWQVWAGVTAGVVITAGLLAFAQHERDVGRQKVLEQQEVAWAAQVQARITGLENELAQARAGLAIAQAGARRVDTLKPPTIVVHDTTWVPQLALTLVQDRAAKLDAACTVLDLKCRQLHAADSAAFDSVNAKLRIELGRTTPRRGWLGRILEDAAAATAGRLSCKL